MNRRRFLAGVGAAAATAAVGVPAVADTGPWGRVPTLGAVLTGHHHVAWNVGDVIEFVDEFRSEPPTKWRIGGVLVDFDHGEII